MTITMDISTVTAAKAVAARVAEASCIGGGVEDTMASDGWD